MIQAHKAQERVLTHRRSTMSNLNSPRYSTSMRKSRLRKKPHSVITNVSWRMRMPDSKRQKRLRKRNLRSWNAH